MALSSNAFPAFGSSLLMITLIVYVRYPSRQRLKNSFSIVSFASLRRILAIPNFENEIV
jgi:hypothetical protein